MKTFLFTITLLLLFHHHGFSQDYSFTNSSLKTEEGNDAYIEVEFKPKIGTTKPGTVMVQIDFKETTAGGKDYEFDENMAILNFREGPLKQIFKVKILNDEKNEQDETVVLILTDHSGSNIDTCVIKILDKDNSAEFFWGSIGGNVNFAEKKLQVNSVYIDLSFKPTLPIKMFGQNFTLSAPIRAFYNNGSGPQQENSEVARRSITIDTTFRDGDVTKVKYWDNRPYLTYTAETRNLGINIPVLLSWKVPYENHVSFFVGYNFEFANITKRQIDLKYIDNLLDSGLVANKQSVPIPDPIKVTDNTDGSSREIPTANVYYRTSKYSTPVPTNVSDDNLFQVYQALTAGTTYKSTGFDCTIRYTWGATVSFLDRRVSGGRISGARPASYPYRHSVQILFLEKKLGIQLLFDARFPKTTDGRSEGYPIYYVSFAKTLNLSGLKEIFFPN